jgi:hypothetical protein
VVVTIFGGNVMVCKLIKVTAGKVVVIDGKVVVT